MDERLIPGLPLARRLETDEALAFTVTLADDVAYQRLAPLSGLATIQGYVLQFDQAVTVRFADQTDAGLEVNAGGFLVGMDTDIDNTDNDGITVLYEGDDPLTIRGQVFGE